MPIDRFFGPAPSAPGKALDRAEHGHPRGGVQRFVAPHDLCAVAVGHHQVHHRQVEWPPSEASPRPSATVAAWRNVAGSGRPSKRRRPSARSRTPETEGVVLDLSISIAACSHSHCSPESAAWKRHRLRSYPEDPSSHRRSPKSSRLPEVEPRKTLGVAILADDLRCAVGANLRPPDASGRRRPGDRSSPTARSATR